MISTTLSEYPHICNSFTASIICLNALNLQPWDCIHNRPRRIDLVHHIVLWMFDLPQPSLSNEEVLHYLKFLIKSTIVAVLMAKTFSQV